MAKYAERNAYNDEVDTLVKKCAALNLICRIKKDRYPFTIICEPDMAMDAQISMLDNPYGHNGKGDGFILRFTDSEPATDVVFKGNPKDFKTIFDQAKKVYQAFTPLFFRETMEEEFLAEKIREYNDARSEADEEALDADFTEGTEALDDLAELAEAGDAAETEE